MKDPETRIVSAGEADLGWCKIEGHKRECLAVPDTVFWTYDLNCCSIQIVRHEDLVAWTAFSKAQSDLNHRGQGTKLVADTSQLQIKHWAVEAVFGTSFMAKYVLNVIHQCDEQHYRNWGDWTMSLGGRFKPFKVR